ncbi:MULTISPECIES: hypothetical protein [unclassified Streptomyces]|uniref:hypothetical protein n=1 Tax=unclassified Streptomyces TaxID=2593676 RepID=UPI0018740164|nr:MULTISPECIES: hypothetical protein [unclassified Streptomyces]QZZ25688.1 hypothetical protein A7X85_04910 [Streptomyces sp. ST1015]
MGTSLTPEFWERFAVLLALAIVVTVALSTVLDALVVRLRHRPPRRPRLPRTPAHR